MWSQFKPVTMVEHPFATAAIEPGEPIGADNTRYVEVPDGLLPAVPVEGVAKRIIDAGNPLLPGDIGSPAEVIPEGWWQLDVEVPASASVGARMLLVLVDSGSVVNGVLTRPAANDTFGSGLGSIAVSPQDAGEVAVAAANGRIAVLASSD